MSRAPRMSRARRVMAKPDLVLTELEYPVTLVTGNDTEAGLQITFNEFVDIAQQGIQFKRSDGQIVWTIPPAGGPKAINANVRSYHAPGGAWVGLNGSESDTPCIELPDGTSSQGLRIWGGASGATSPGINYVGVARVGDYFFRKRTTAGTIISACSVAGNPGTWVAVD